MQKKKKIESNNQSNLLKEKVVPILPRQIIKATHPNGVDWHKDQTHTSMQQNRVQSRREPQGVCKYCGESSLCGKWS